MRKNIQKCAKEMQQFTKHTKSMCKTKKNAQLSKEVSDAFCISVPMHNPVAMNFKKEEKTSSPKHHQTLLDKLGPLLFLWNQSVHCLLHMI